MCSETKSTHNEEQRLLFACGEGRKGPPHSAGANGAHAQRT